MLRGDKVVPLGRALGDWLLGAGVFERSAQAELERAWQTAAGETLARQTRLLGLRRQELWVEVSSAPLRAELESFRKGELLTALREGYGRRHIENIRFRVSGSLPGTSSSVEPGA